MDTPLKVGAEDFVEMLQEMREQNKSPTSWKLNMEWWWHNSLYFLITGALPNLLPRETARNWLDKYVAVDENFRDKESFLESKIMEEVGGHDAYLEWLSLGKQQTDPRYKILLEYRVYEVKEFLKSLIETIETEMAKNPWMTATQKPVKIREVEFFDNGRRVSYLGIEKCLDIGSVAHIIVRSCIIADGTKPRGEVDIGLLLSHLNESAKSKKQKSKVRQSIHKELNEINQPWKEKLGIRIFRVDGSTDRLLVDPH